MKKTHESAAVRNSRTAARKLSRDTVFLIGDLLPQLDYAGVGAPLFFCDTVELFSTLLRPEQVRTVRAAYVQDMALADWDQPVGHWFDATLGFYVVGSRRHGSMGPTFASFAAADAAQKFATAWGGRVLRYAEIRPEMADLSGGARHDTRM